MPGHSVAVHEIRWSEVFPGLLLFRAVRLAAEAPKLLLATTGMLLTWAGWFAAGRLFLALPASESTSTPVDAWARQLADAGAESQFAPSLSASWWRLVEVAEQIVRPAWGIFDGPTDLSTLGLLVLCTLWTAAVWALLAGALTRIAAVQLGRGERLGLRPALRFAARKWSSYFGAPLMPLAVVAALVVMLAPIGWLLRAGEAGAWIAAVLWPIVLLLGVFLTILVVGLLFGWPLMWGAVSAENGDAFTALSNSYAYVYQRPWHYLAYGAAACLLGTIGWIAFQLLAGLLLYLTAWALGWSSGIAAGGLWGDPAVPFAVDRVASETFRVGDVLPARSEAFAVHGGWRNVVAWVVSGYGVSYFWTAATGIYLLLRQSLDGTELDSVYLEDDQPRAGLPPLAADERGVPVTLRDEAPPADLPASRADAPD